jgi:hypothetical protein
MCEKLRLKEEPEKLARGSTASELQRPGLKSETTNATTQTFP